MKFRNLYLIAPFCAAVVLFAAGWIILNNVSANSTDNAAAPNPSTPDQDLYFETLFSFDSKSRSVKQANLNSIQREKQLEQIEDDRTSFNLNAAQTVGNWGCRITDVIALDGKTFILNGNAFLMKNYKWLALCKYPKAPDDKSPLAYHWIELAFKSLPNVLETAKPGSIIHFDGKRIFHTDIKYGDPSCSQPTSGLCFEVDHAY